MKVQYVFLFEKKHQIAYENNTFNIPNSNTSHIEKCAKMAPFKICLNRIYFNETISYAHTSPTENRYELRFSSILLLSLSHGWKLILNYRHDLQ